MKIKVSRKLVWQVSIIIIAILCSIGCIDLFISNLEKELYYFAALALLPLVFIIFMIGYLIGFQNGLDRAAEENVAVFDEVLKNLRKSESDKDKIPNSK